MRKRRKKTPPNATPKAKMAAIAISAAVDAAVGAITTAVRTVRNAKPPPKRLRTMTTPKTVNRAREKRPACRARTKPVIAAVGAVGVGGAVVAYAKKAVRKMSTPGIHPLVKRKS
jgi:hypothetical protein